ncbi:MAG TPA: cytochrome c3 family protein [Terriglobales bacterium]|nr:cytochrome c3 family protein [Terriglobales bacterium]
MISITKPISRAFLLLISLILILSARANAQLSNADCLNCHGDKTLSKTEKGKTISLYLDESALKKSIHGELDCVDCHKGITELPHSEQLPPPDCGACHSDTKAIVSKGMHNLIKDGCWSCHGSHDIKSAQDPSSITNKNNRSELCLKCHKDREDVYFTSSEHSSVVFPSGAKGKVYCYQCHDSHRASLPDPLKVCGTCHNKIFTDLNKSVHATAKLKEIPNCCNCHSEHKVKTGEKENKFSLLTQEITGCKECHPAETESFFQGTHGKEFVKKNPDVPSCVSCHGAHGILSAKDPESPIFHNNIIRLCAKCHEDQKLASKYQNLPQPVVLKAYENSVHGMAVEKHGLLAAPVCTDCHGAHEMRPVDDPESPVNKVNLAHTCAKCHAGIYNVYEQSIHGTSLAKGILDSPTCSDCHGEHDITEVRDPSGKVSPTNIPKTCSACHSAERIVKKYGLLPVAYDTYLNSFHGIAHKYGEMVVADCSSCHGYHDILPSSDPRSSINPKNIPQTCGKCHKGASENFAKGKVHIQATKESSLGVYIVRTFYTWFIGILGILFAIYIILDVLGRRRRRIERI